LLTQESQALLAMFVDQVFSIVGLVMGSAVQDSEVSVCPGAKQIYAII